MRLTTVLLALACAARALAGTIQVRGQAERMVEPDTIVCRFDVAATHQEAGEAAEEFARRQNAVIADLAAAGFTTNEVAMNTVAMTPQFEYGSASRRTFKGFRCEATHRVTCAFDRARLAKLYGALAGGACVEGFNVDFTCRESEALMRELRREAVADAIRKANEYAQGFGVVVKGLERAEEAQTDFMPVEAGVRCLAARNAKFDETAAPDFEKLTPQRVRFESSVSATFKTE